MLIVTNNGSRIYLTTTKELVKPIRAMYPPSNEDLEVKSSTSQGLMHQSIDHKVMVDHANDANLIAMAFKREQVLMVYAASSRILTYFGSRLDAKTRQTVGEAPWVKFSQNCSPNSEGVACWPLSSCASVSAEVKSLLSDRITQAELPVTHTHELARQVYLLPDFFLAHNEEESEILCHLRPIDVVCLWLSKLPLDECQSRLENAIKCWKRAEIIAMLYIIVADSSFEYYSGAELERALNEQKQPTNNSFMSSKSSDSYKITSANKLDPGVRQKAGMLADTMSAGAEQDLLKEKESDDEYDIFGSTRLAPVRLETCTVKEQALCVYAARLLRPVWNRKADELSVEQTHVVSTKLRDFMKFLEETPPDLKAMSTKKKEGKEGNR